MLNSQKNRRQTEVSEIGLPPILNILKIGIVSRDYRLRYENNYRDFSYILPELLKLLDEKGCDAVLFSLFSVVPRDTYSPNVFLEDMINVKAVFLEEFKDTDQGRFAGRYVICHRTKEQWDEYDFHQRFATITGMSKMDIDDFVKNEMSKRILGNCCVLLCGETNGVKYSPKAKKVQDTFGLRAAIPRKANIILNPIHDRMTRFEMKLKRKFLSENGRWVISVWNKGKEDKNGKVKDGSNPAWTVFHNGEEKRVQLIENQFGVELGILDIKNVQ